jgi:hypothetical protein
LGRLLTAADYQAEQDYHRHKQQLQNRILFGTGVVAGLRVSIAHDELTVSPGLAYDCQGHELLLREEHREPVVKDGSPRYVTLRYQERATGWVPVPALAHAAEDAEPQAAYTEETVELCVTRSFVHLPHREVSARVAGCESPHGVCLAKIHWQGRRWSVRPLARRIHLAW